MIEGKVFLPYKNKIIEAFIEIQEGTLGIEMIIPFSGIESLEIIDEVRFRIIPKLVFFGKDNKKYSVENAVFFNLFSNIDENRLAGIFEAFLLGESIYSEGHIQIHFLGMENVFKDLNELNDREKSKNKWELKSIGEKVVVQRELNNIHNLLELRKIVNQTREFFDFLLDEEIYLDYIMFEKCKGDISEQVGRILYDKELNYLSPKSIYVEAPRKKTYRHIEDDLEEWNNQYDKYHEVIEIWRKTLRCKGISEEDRFIWMCQSFELMCSMNEEINKLAKSTMSAKQKEPNIYNYLKAVNQWNKIFTYDDSYFLTVKKARDIYTHYNVKKNIGELAWKNSVHIIECAFYRTMEKMLSISRKKSTFFLLVIPEADDKPRRRIINNHTTSNK